MTVSVSNPNLTLLYGLDESNPVAVRVQSSPHAGGDSGFYDLEPRNATGNEGVPSVNDGEGGKAANTELNPGAPYTSTRRWLASSQASIATHETNGVLFDPDNFTSGDAFVWGSRFNWPGFKTGGSGGTDRHHLFGLRSPAVNDGVHWMQILPDTNITPATGGELEFKIGNATDVIDSGWTTVTGAPPADYIDDAGWWRWAMRVRYFDATNVVVKVFVWKEADGTLYTFEKNFAKNTIRYTTAQKARTDYEWTFGCSFAQSDQVSHFGAQDEGWFYKGDLSDDEIQNIVENGISVPWNEEDVTILEHDVRVSHYNEKGAFPKPRQLPVGGTAMRHPAGSWGSRIRLHYEGYRPARPWSLRRVAVQFDTGGPRPGRQNNEQVFDRLTNGIVRLPGRMNSGNCEDARNVEFSGLAPRRRRGFKIRRNVDDTFDTGINSFHYFRSYDDELHGVYKVGEELFAESGDTSTSIDTGWDIDDQVSYAVLDDRCIILSDTKRVSYRGGGAGGLDDFGVPAPGGTLTATATGIPPGTLDGTYGYTYTWYDPITGDESAPYTDAVFASPSIQSVDLGGIDTVGAPARFTQMNIYRTVAGGAEPDLFLIDFGVTLAATYNDDGLPDGTDQIDHVNGEYITGDPIDEWGASVVHKERMFYFLGEENPEKVYWSEPNEPMRWYGGSFTIHEGPVTAVFSMGDRLIVFTRRTVELVESDFVRDTNGNYQIRRTVLSREVGCLGHAAVDDLNGVPYWIDTRGIFHLRGDRIVEVSQSIRNVFPRMNTGRGYAFTCSRNHIRDQLWFTVSVSGFQLDTTRLQTQIVMSLGENGHEWTFYSLEASYAAQFDDDLNGQRYGIMDHLGVFKEMELYEGDGVNDPASIASCEGTIASVSGGVITVSGTSPSWVVDEHRGRALLVRNETTGVLSYGLIARNSTNTLTVVGGVPSDIGLVASLDEYFIGGFNAYLDPAQQDLGTTNMKIARHLHTEFDDLTSGLFW